MADTRAMNDDDVRSATPATPRSTSIGSGTWAGFRPIRARKPYEEAAEQIADALRSGALRVGDRLPSERVLAEQMEISRPTLREAVKLLVLAGVIEVRRGPAGGMFVVSDIIPPDFSSDRAAVDTANLAGVLEARRLLEPRVAQLAALYATNDDFEAMQRAIDLVARLGHDPTRRFQLDARFHLTMARATRNETVVEFMRVLFRHLEVARNLIAAGEDEPEATVRIHERTLRAIMAGDPAEIERVMEEHLSTLERRWEQETGRSRLRRVPDFLLPAPAEAGS